MESRRCLIILSSTARMWLSFSVMRSSTSRCLMAAKIRSRVASRSLSLARIADFMSSSMRCLKPCGGGLARAHGGGRFIYLATASLGQHPGFFASALEATQGDFKRLVFTQFHRRHTDFTSVFGTKNKNSRDG